MIFTNLVSNTLTYVIDCYHNCLKLINLSKIIKRRQKNDQQFKLSKNVRGTFFYIFLRRVRL